MNKDKLIKNIIEQMKEAQIKLGYARETVRLYYPLGSLNTLLGTEANSAEELVTFLKEKKIFSDTVLGSLGFAVSGKRIEISIPPKGAFYVWKEVESPAFLMDIIKLFGENHRCTLKDICNVFERYSKAYVCEKMPEGMDFDFVLHFEDTKIDAYYYCIKEEMGHTIYHRFTKEDYQALME